MHEGRRYLVTGATSGIGLATCRLLASQGAELVLVARRAELLAETIADLPGSQHASVCFDLERLSEIPEMVEQAAKQVGGLHGLVHAAGIHATTPLRMMKPTTAAKVFALNVTAGAMLVSGFRSKRVRRPGSSVVLMSSAVGLVGDKGVGIYAASKGAVVTMAKSFALELAPEDVRVNAVCPGVVMTPMTSALRDEVGSDAFADVEARHPLGFGTPDDVAHGISFLLSPQARWITGSSLVIDGGYTAQ